jgi:hypothetical protein
VLLCGPTYLVDKNLYRARSGAESGSGRFDKSDPDPRQDSQLRFKSHLFCQSPGVIGGQPGVDE